MPFIPKPPQDDKWTKQQQKPCNHPEHNPPGMIVLPPGEHTWKCPACGEESTFTVPMITC